MGSGSVGCMGPHTPTDDKACRCGRSYERGRAPRHERDAARACYAFSSSFCRALCAFARNSGERPVDASASRTRAFACSCFPPLCSACATRGTDRQCLVLRDHRPCRTTGRPRRNAQEKTDTHRFKLRQRAALSRSLTLHVATVAAVMRSYRRLAVCPALSQRSPAPRSLQRPACATPRSLPDLARVSARPCAFETDRTVGTACRKPPLLSRDSSSDAMARRRRK